MTQWVDFTEIRSRVSLEAVLFQYYAIDNLKRHGNKLIGPCPVHNGDSPRAFHADLDKNVWHCFSQCKRGGNQLDLVAVKEGIGIRQAALRLQDAFLGSPDSESSPDIQSFPAPSPAPVPTSAPASEPGTEPTPSNHPPHNPPLDVILNVKADHPHLLKERGLDMATIEHFGIGYCSRGIMRGTIAIPVHNEKDQLVAYAGRRLKPSDVDQFGKYKFPKGFRKEAVLFNLNRAKELAKEKGLILVEGFFSVFYLHQVGFPNTVAAMGCELSNYQADFLCQAKDVIVLFDGNEAGWSGAETARSKIAGRVPVRIARLPQDTEPEDLSVKALRWLIQGMQVLDMEEVSFRFAELKPLRGESNG